MQGSSRPANRAAADAFFPSPFSASGVRGAMHRALLLVGRHCRCDLVSDRKAQEQTEFQTSFSQAPSAQAQEEPRLPPTACWGNSVCLNSRPNPRLAAHLHSPLYIADALRKAPRLRSARRCCLHCFVVASRVLICRCGLTRSAAWLLLLEPPPLKRAREVISRGTPRPPRPMRPLRRPEGGCAVPLPWPCPVPVPAHSDGGRAEALLHGLAYWCARTAGGGGRAAVVPTGRAKMPPMHSSGAS